MEPSTATADNKEPPSLSAAIVEGASGTIVVEVGPERSKYNVNKAFLSYYSDYFKKALCGPWREAEEGIIPLPDVEPAVFNLFIEWLYTQNLPEVYYGAWEAALELGIDRLEIRMLKLKLYVFADRFLVPSLHEFMSLAIINGDPREPRWPEQRLYDEIIYVFNNLPSTDPLLDYFVGSHVMAWDRHVDQDSLQAHLRSQLPHDFLVRFMLQVTKAMIKEDEMTRVKFIMDTCTYHVYHTEKARKRCVWKSETKQEAEVWMRRETLQADTQEDGAMEQT